VTNIGTNAFDGWRSLRSVEIGEDCVSIGARAFNKCYNVTNMAYAATAKVGDYAFLRCNSLETLSFGADTTFGETPFALYAGIYMKENGLPEVYAIPSVSVAGKKQQLQGSTDLKNWTNITDEAQKASYNFFKIVLVDDLPQ